MRDLPPPVVLSRAFFDLYDFLAHDAADLDDASTGLQESKAKRMEAQEALADQQQKLRATRAYIKEQKDRINLVLTHWFYGTTLLQPQLWLRGGCKGKIERARTKLTQAQDRDLPEILRTIHRLQNEDLPRLDSIVHHHLDHFDLCANAASEREVMRQRAFLEYPTRELLRLTGDEDSIQITIRKLTAQGSELEDAISKLADAKKTFDHSGHLLGNALEHCKKAETLKTTRDVIPKPVDSLNSLHYRSRNETLVSDGTKIVTIVQKNGERDIFHLDRHGKILTTNYPCPSGCGFLVTWHSTHCCSSCQRQHGEHGARCERKVVASQQGAQQKLNKLLRNQSNRTNSIRKEDEARRSLLSQARQASKTADLLIIHSLRFLYSCTPSMSPSVAPVARPWDVSSQSDCSCAQIRASNIETEVRWVAARNTSVAQHLAKAKDAQAKLRRDIRHAEEELQDTRARLQQEQDSIFELLRTRAQLLDNQSPSTCTDEVGDMSMRPPPFAPHDHPPATAPSANEISYASW